MLSDKDKQFNRQINYFIMRHMWQVIRGRKRNDGDTIYDAFSTSRERYTRIINTGTVRYGKGELDGLQQSTGLRKEIFTGDARFECSYSVKTKGGMTQQTITTEEWVELFKWRRERSNNRGEKPKQEKKQETCQDVIYNKLKRVPRDDINNWDFYRLCFYIKNMKAAPLRESTGKLREIETAIKELSFSLLDGCEEGQLQKFQKLLREKQNLVNAIIVYRKAKKEECKSKS